MILFFSVFQYAPLAYAAHAGTCANTIIHEPLAWTWPVNSWKWRSSKRRTSFFHFSDYWPVDEHLPEFLRHRRMDWRRIEWKETNWKRIGLEKDWIGVPSLVSFASSAHILNWMQTTCSVHTVKWYMSQQQHANVPLFRYWCKQVRCGTMHNIKDTSGSQLKRMST